MEERNGLKGVIILLLEFKQTVEPFFKKIILISFIGGLLGATLSFFSGRIYTSQSSIIVESGEGGGIGKYLQLAQSFGVGAGGGGNAILTPENVQGLLVSKRIIYTTLLKEVKFDDFEGKLANYYLDVFNSTMKDSLPEGKITGSDVFLSNNKEERVLNSLYQILSMSMIEVMISKHNSIIEVKVRSENQHFSHYFGKELIQSLYQYYKKNLINDEVVVVDLMQHKCDSIYALLQQRELELAGLNDRSKLTVKSVANIQTMRVNRDVQFLTGIYIETVKNLEIAKFSMLQNKKIFKILDESVLPIKGMKKGLVISAILYSILLGVFSTITFLLIKEFKSAQIELQEETTS